MKSLLLGFLKGGVIGGAVGYGAYALGLGAGWLWLVYGAVGLLVGFLVGRPVWSLLTDKSSTSFVAILKALVGFGVAVGLWALAAKVWGGFRLTLDGQSRWIYEWQPIFGAAVGALWGAFVEVDDAVGDAKPAAKQAAKPAAKPAGAERKRK